MARALILIAMVMACSKTDDGGAVDKLLAPGSGWKCVEGRCDRSCVYPLPGHYTGSDGQVVTAPSPPCVDAAKAFCTIAGSPARNARAECRATRQGCEAVRSAGAPACVER